MVFLRQESTISVALMQFMKSMQYTGARWEVLFAGLVLILLPLLLLYLWLGSRLIEGIAAGYSK
jgi:multiple sugar transport system permease protein/N-acetylglucosamine transport system permease protein